MLLFPIHGPCSRKPSQRLEFRLHSFQVTDRRRTRFHDKLLAGGFPGVGRTLGDDDVGSRSDGVKPKAGISHTGLWLPSLTFLRISGILFKQNQGAIQAPFSYHTSTASVILKQGSSSKVFCQRGLDLGYLRFVN